MLYGIELCTGCWKRRFCRAALDTFADDSSRRYVFFVQCRPAIDPFQDRAHRIGAIAESIQCIYLLGDHTVDDSVHRSLSTKFKLNDAVVDGGDNAKGFKINEVSSFCVELDDLTDFGISIGSSKIPRTSEDTLTTWLKKASVPIPITDAPEFIVSAPEFYKDNKVNTNSKSFYVNLTEWDGEIASACGSGDEWAWVCLTDASADNVTAMRGLPANRRADAIRHHEVLAVFARRAAFRQKKDRHQRTLDEFF